MSSQGRILIVDDLEAWRDILSHTLRQAGFETQTASSISEAVKFLSEEAYHLLVLDIRLDDMNEADKAGMDFLHQIAHLGLESAVQVIMLSAYGTLDQMRSAFRDFRVADFMAKEDFDGTEFLRQVQHTFENKVKINFDLTICWDNGQDIDLNLADLELDNRLVGQDATFLRRISEELDDLLKRIFYQADRVVTKPLVPGFSGTSVLQAQPFFKGQGNGQPVVVKFGDYRKIEEEYENFKKFVEPFVGGGRCTTVRDLRRTSRLGGIAYSLLGAANEQIEDFKQFYQRADIDQIICVLNNLFHHTCHPWYESAKALKPYNLTEVYAGKGGLTWAELDQRRKETLTSVSGQETLKFEMITSEALFSNPILAADQMTFTCETSYCITHGDLNDTNVWVDTGNNAWLIDFQHTGEGHLLRDVIKLDSVVRFQLLDPTSGTLDDRLEMEKALNQFDDLDVKSRRLFTNHAALAKAFQVSLHLRTIATQLKAQIGSDDSYEYHIGSFYQALNTLRFENLPRRQREHALLSASLLVDHLPS